MSMPENIFLIGPMGAGKSTIGRFVAKLLKLNFFDTDQVIVERTGADLAWIFDIEGEEGFQKREEKVVEELTKKSGIVIATGGRVVLSAKNRTALVSRGAVVYLKASIDQQVERTKKDTKRPLLRCKDDLRSKLISMREELEPQYYALADYTVETDGHSIQAVANKIVKTISDIP